jgi:hypothetical protein
MASEQDTAIELPVLGALTYRELHAFEDGLFAGVVNERSHDYDREQHYWRMGWLAGRAIAWAS